MTNGTILIIAVTYNSDDEAIDFIKNIANLYHYQIELEIIIVDNTENSNRERLAAAINNNIININYIRTPQNLGYFGGARYGLLNYLKERSYPDWLIVCNVDLQVVDKYIFQKLLLIQECRIGIVAPSIISSITGIDKNPGIQVRPNYRKFLIYKLVFSSHYTYNIYVSMSYLKGWLKRLLEVTGARSNLKISTVRIYAPHGSFIILSKTYFQAGGTLNYPEFLFNEEIFLAETARSLNLDVMYYPKIKILDNEHVSTGKFRSKSMVRYMYESSNYIYNTYFSRTPVPITYEQPVLPETSNICGIIVTFNPEDLLVTISSIIDKVGKLVIVDNGSPSSYFEDMSFIISKTEFHLIKNSENVGIAAALNQGVRYAIANGFSWVLTLDQDSICLPNIIENYQVVYKYYPIKEKIGIIATNYAEKKIGTTAINKKKNVITSKNYYELDEVITSGSLLPTTVFNKAGMFREDFFIYYVDHEFCARLRGCGYKVLLTKEVGMMHSTGNCTRNKFFGLSFVQYNYAPFKNYYISRNSILLFKCYFSSSPAWATRMLFSSFKRSIKTIFFEQDKFIKLKYIFCGLIHGVLGKGGKLMHTFI